MKVRFGLAVKGGKPHMIVGTTSCPVAAGKPLITTLKPSEVNADDVCFWCRRSANLEAASRANCYGKGWSQSLDRLLADIEPVYTIAEQRALSAEIAAFPVYASSGFSGAVFSPKQVVEVEDDLLSLITPEPVKQLSVWGSLRANNLRTLPQSPKRARRHVKLAA